MWLHRIQVPKTNRDKVLTADCAHKQISASPRWLHCGFQLERRPLSRRFTFDLNAQSQSNTVFKAQITAQHRQLQNALIIKTGLPQLMDVLFCCARRLVRQPPRLCEE